MNSLDAFPDDVLHAELKRRKENRCRPLTPLTNPSFASLVELMKWAVAECAKPDGRVKDIEHYVFEMAAEAVYGKEFWYWWNRPEIQERHD